jgi:hypothetical protein
MLGPSSGSTLTPPAASAVTNSLRQATSRDLCNTGVTMVLFATSSRRQSRGVGRCVTLANGQRHTAAPNVWAAFLLHLAKGASAITVRNQALALKTPRKGQ